MSHKDLIWLLCVVYRALCGGEKVFWVRIARIGPCVVYMRSTWCERRKYLVGMALCDDKPQQEIVVVPYCAIIHPYRTVEWDKKANEHSSINNMGYRIT